MWIKFYPYTLERFSHVSPAGAPTALCCQTNEVTAFHSLTGHKEREREKIIPSVLDLFMDLSLITSLVATSHLKHDIFSTWSVQSNGAGTVLFTLSCVQQKK